MLKKKQENGKVSKKLVQKYLLCVPHYPRVGKASWSRLNSPVVEHWFTTKKQQNADIILFCLLYVAVYRFDTILV